jgi:membrane-associated phospholipid phosphatase
LTLVLILAAAAAWADPVTDWNGTLLQAIRTDRTPPPKASRAMACVHVAIYDAVVGLLGGYEPYHVTSSAPAGASPEAAAAAAAHRALVALFPAQQAAFDAALATALAAIPNGPAKTNGVTWGEQVAGEILALRANDHAADTAPYTPPTGGLWWTPTPPAFAPALLPNWPTVTPWTMTSGTQFRQGAPPSAGSSAYTSALREVRRLGRVDSHFRTPEQTQIALFWADGAGTATPPGHWLEIASGIVLQRGTPLLQNARLFALLSLAVADAAIVSWDNKYYYSDWRPVTGIQHAELAGDPDITPDPSWTPLIATPPFPSYTSGHSTFSGASSQILALFFGADDVAFTTTSDGLPGVQRSFSSFSAAAEEAGQSRIYGGIHWQYDNQAGLSSGRSLAEHVFFNFLTPIVAASPCTTGPTVLCLGNGRFKVTAQWRTASASGAGHAQSLGDDSGQFWFFAADNTELVVKVLDACAGFDRFWVFASGLTNVEVTLTVTDTQNGRTRRYFNPLGKPFASVQDVSAFATCP